MADGNLILSNIPPSAPFPSPISNPLLLRPSGADNLPPISSPYMQALNLMKARDLGKEGAVRWGQRDCIAEHDFKTEGRKEKRIRGKEGVDWCLCISKQISDGISGREERGEQKCT